MRTIWQGFRGFKPFWQVVIGASVALFIVAAATGPEEEPVTTTAASATRVPEVAERSAAPDAELKAEGATPTTEAAALPPTTSAPTTTAAPTTTTAPPPPPTTEPPAPVESISQANARRSADNYLDIMPFSRSGLIKQLEFEGFSTADATHGVDAASADWNEQAAKSAANYLEIMPFSHGSLVDQLVFEGYTREQAEYGVGTTGL